MSRTSLLWTSASLSLCTLCSAQVLEFEIDGTGPQGMLGYSVDFVGDLTGDGIDEFVAGAPLDGPIGPRRGAAYVFDGATNAIVHQWDGLDDWELGYAVAGPGDIDLDGVPDVLVGVQRINTYAGRFYLYSGADGSVIYTRDGTQDYAYMGAALTGLGDADGDGWRDFAVSATGYVDATAVVTVYSGRDGGIHWQTNGGSEAHIGYSLDGLGDIDGDGLGDLIVGASGANSGGVGEVFIYSGADGSVLFHYTGSPNARLGREVSSAGDVDQDGTHDFMFNVTGDNLSGTYPKVRLYSGASGLLIHEWSGAGFFGRFGQGLRPAGDQNGDGVPELLISQSMASVALEKLWLVDGATKTYLHGFELGQSSGYGLAANGRLNGHGPNDILVGIPAEGIQARPGKVRGYSLGCSAAPITTYCSTSPNSVGAGSSMGWTGGSRIADNDLRLEASSSPPGQFGIFFYGTSQAAVPFGDGLRCISGAVSRLPIVNTGTGVASFALDLTNLPAGGPILAGRPYFFQFWYRDPSFGLAGFNLSDGLSVEFCL